MEILHTPVLLEPCLKWLSPKNEPFENNAFLIDSTLGEGGHSSAFLSAYPNLHVLGIDIDKEIQSRAEKRLAVFGERMRFFNGWFDDFFADYPAEFEKPDLILFDLGISSFHYEKSGRGFSFRYDENLDMRLNCDEKKTATDIINNMNEEELSDLIFRYSEERLSKKIARAVVEARSTGKIYSSKTLADIIFRAVPAEYRYARIHPATKTFQALRIAVNGELKRLANALHNAFNVLNCGGKIGVITFHSLEDRIVKTYFKNLGKRCICPPEQAECTCGGKSCAEILTKKPVVPDEREIKSNSASRSAKLRVVRKLRNACEQRFIKIGKEAV